MVRNANAHPPFSILLPVILAAGLGWGSFSATSSAAGDDGDEGAMAIIVAHETAKADALRAYIEANPEAPDLHLAWSELGNSLEVIGDLEALSKVLEQRYDAVDKTSDDRMVIGQWLQEVVGPLMGLYATFGDRERANAFLDRVLEDTKENPMAQDLAQYVEFMRGQLSVPIVGDEMEIAFTALDGREVDLADMKGKVVLVDFWATWCQPCVVEMPHLLKAYHAYHEKGFEIIGISLDQNEAALKKFIDDLEIPWPQHFTGTDNEFAEKFSIQAIPATFLIGTDGKVVATDLRGDQLEQWLSELLGGE